MCLNVGVFALSFRMRIRWDFGLTRPWWAMCATRVHYYRWRWLWLLFAGNGPSAPAASPRSDSQKKKRKKAIRATVLCAISQCTEIINLQHITSTFHTKTRPSSPAEAHLENIRWKVWVVSCEWTPTWQKYFSVHLAGLIFFASPLSVAKHTKLISICVRNYFL